MRCSWIQTTPVQHFSAEAVSTPMLFTDERVLEFKGEIKDDFLHVNNSRKSHDIDMNFYPHTSKIKKIKKVSAIFINHIYSQVMSVSLEVPNKKLWVKSLFNKTKTEAFWRITDTNF